MTMQMDDKMANYGKQKPQDNVQMDDEMKNYHPPFKREVQMSNDMKDYRGKDSDTNDARQVREMEEQASRRKEDKINKDLSRQAERENRAQNKLARDELREQAKRDKQIKAAEKEVESIREKQERTNRGTNTKDFRDMAQKNKGKEPYKPVAPINAFTIAKKVGSVAGGVILSGAKNVVSDGHGRSGKRASLAYRAANRNYNTEAKKMGSQVAPVGSFSSKMLFGVDKTPVRSRAKGMNQFSGISDPLSNFTSGTLLGQRPIQQDTAIEGLGRKMVRETHKKKTDPLKSFSKLIGGF